MYSLNAKLGSYFELSFMMEKVGNLDTIWADYFELFFIMVEEGNLDTKLDGYFMYSS